MPLGACHNDGLFLLTISKGFHIAIPRILPEDNLKWLGKILLYFVYFLVALSAEGVFEIRCGDGGMLPFCRKSRAKDATAIECIGYNAIRMDGGQQL